ncbi:MAG TPA: hypothetical protein VHQ94_12595 [Pyrinomonadaceae bacterium]|jgi:hypothetical protein|nr:hypothetical protein [Pyrinomonadaceae bacterium]
MKRDSSDSQDQERFHVVVQNYNKLHSFVDNFDSVVNFDPSRDKVYVFDCSSPEQWKAEVLTANGLVDKGLTWNKNLFFVRRRNWGVNHGAQLDYFRCLLDGTIAVPRYSAFVQEHYFDLENYVKEDTIPEDVRYDLNEIERRFESHKETGCVFFARNGIRVCVSNPATNGTRDFFGDASELLEGSTQRCFCTDGGNFVVRPELFLNYFRRHPSYLTKGNGSYGFSHVWETRLGKILYDQKTVWTDMYRDASYRTVDELRALEQSRNEELSMLWYDNWLWYFFHGRDQQRYSPVDIRAIASYFIRDYLPNAVLCDRNKRLQFVTPDTI